VQPFFTCIVSTGVAASEDDRRLIATAALMRMTQVHTQGTQVGNIAENAPAYMSSLETKDSVMTPCACALRNSRLYHAWVSSDLVLVE
jgi:hypothetical protein